MTENNKIKLALLWGKYGGDITSINDLVIRLDRERFEVIFIYLRSGGMEKTRLLQAGYKVYDLSDKKKLGTLNPGFLLRLSAILKEHKIDILHCHAHKATVYGAIAAKLAGTPIVLAHVHGMNRSRNIKRKIVNYFVHKKVNKIICVAKGVKENVLKDNKHLSENKVTVLENSIDYNRFSDVQITKEQIREKLGFEKEAVIFGTIGRLAPTKGQEFLISAFVQVKQKIPQAVLVIVGRGFLEDELKKQAAETDFSESICFLGQRKNVPEILKALDYFVFPSVNEAFGLALAEAMAAGVPCIASNVGGIPEVTDGQQTCILVPSQDSEALSRAMLAITSEPVEQVLQRAHKAKDRIHQFYSHEIIFNKLKNLYEDEFKTLS